jgi:hypothetical protein
VVKNLISNLVTDYIQKKREEPGLFSFEYNLLPKLISNFYALHGPGIRVRVKENAKIRLFRVDSLSLKDICNIKSLKF